ncbi:MAG TPA: beta-ketoacyl synthase N-terminal-like domain-containing protein [Thermoanaerobaculia bacterium]|nr:beta-ketoacyl synthase N-terminal-like domain-containing protein [Thermoanaerobaculia bacterium]
MSALGSSELPHSARRIVLTGSAAVTPFGNLEQSVEGVRARRSALAPVRAFDASAFTESRGGECRDFDARPWFRVPKSLKLADQRTRLAVGAAAMAFTSAGLGDDDAAGTGVLIGTTAHDMQTTDVGRALGPPSEGDVNDVDHFGARILRKLPPLWLLLNLPNMASAHVAIELGARGPNSTITTEWIAGLQAIGEAARWIADGDADVVVAGGADCGILPLLYATLDEEGYFGDPASPFVPAEAAALFVVEELEHARRRGARILGEITGYSSAAGDGAIARTMKAAMRQSGSPEVDLICDAALFARDCREEEGRAIRDVFATPPTRFECNSLLGFSMSAAAPVALALALAADPAQRRTILVNSLGAMQQAASLAVISGEPQA